jgi:asparagine synthase (glutamine-hydrolysing)
MWLRDINAHIVFSEKQRISLWGGEGINIYFPGGNFKPDLNVSGLNRGLYFDQTFYLPGDILVKVDRASMANGLEVRSPFLDRDLVEFIQTIPSALKVKDEKTKVLLRAVCGKYWPEEVRSRNKQGFGAPSTEWLKRSDVLQLVDRVFEFNSPLSRLLPGVGRHKKSENPYQTWILLVLGLWLEKHKIN